MPQMNVSVVGTGGEYEELFQKYRIVELPHDIPIRVETLDGGMQGGKPSIGFIIELPAEKIVVLAQTSVKLFQMAAWATFAKYGDLTGDARLTKLAADGAATIHLGSSQVDILRNVLASILESGELSGNLEMKVHAALRDTASRDKS